MAAFLMQLKQWGVLGFRSGTPWKRVVAAVGYAFVVFWIIAGLNGKPGVTFFGLAVLLVGLLIANGWSLRSRLPSLSSTSRPVAVMGWGIVAIVLISTWACAAAQTPTSPTNPTSLARGSGGVGGGAPAISGPESSSTATPTPKPTPP